MLGNGFAGSANMAESRFAAALLTIILLSKVEVAIGGNIENLFPSRRAMSAQYAAFRCMGVACNAPTIAPAPQ
jgi:hypothetical protein